MKRPVEAVDANLVEFLRESLTEEVVAVAFKKLRERIQEHGERASSDLPLLLTREKEIELKLKRLAEALTASDKPPVTVVQMMAEQEQELTAVRQRMEALKASASVLDLEARRLEKDAMERLKHLHGALERNPAEARVLLERLLVGPLVWTPIDTPEGRRFDIRGELDPTGVASGEGAGSTPPFNGVPNGTPPILSWLEMRLVG